MVMVKGGEIGGLEGGWLERPRQWRGARWAGLSPGSAELPIAARRALRRHRSRARALPRHGTAKTWHCQDSHLTTLARLPPVAAAARHRAAVPRVPRRGVLADERAVRGRQSRRDLDRLEQTGAVTQRARRLEVRPPLVRALDVLEQIELDGASALLRVQAVRLAA